MKKLSQAIALTSAVSAALLAAHSVQAEVEVSASAAIANMYLWRGQDLGQGVPAVSGDVTASMGGLYGGVWASSGDSALGQEYDLYLGYGGEAGEFSYDISAWTYVYPGASEDADDDGNYTRTDARGTTFDASDLIISVGYGPVSASYYYVLAGDENASYATLGGEMGAFAATLGMQMHSEDDSAEYTHLDLSYAYNDNLSFTLSKIIDQDADLDKGESGLDEDTKVVVSYSLPIEL
ncbi:histidine kinase [Bacterioplanes sanyensis]|uniref:Histidine kinase n=1 Tax=Bacterioplanes sanyensis TaxID=1249553 RepID=A0A222FHI6_9GAMM|nr:TorF family putative porin [Bacterioplanes sanyensis]ASP38102.1 histidine kinase [Bacterioplanes sanyensis]